MRFLREKLHSISNKPSRLTENRPKSENFLLPSAVSQNIASEVKRSKLEFANMAPITESSIHVAFSCTEI